MSAAWLLPVVTASLIGSLHCAGMCGGFVAAYAGSDDSRGARRAASHLAYHAGRLVIYALLGAAAGVLGAALDVASVAAGAGRVTALIAGIAMIAWALAALLRAGGLWSSERARNGPIRRAVIRWLAKLAAKPPLVRGALLGLASALLPCGWLYAFVIAAAGTGSALGGASLMAAFWSGTVPLLLGLGVSVQSIAPRLRRHVPVLSAAALLILGLSAVLGRWNPSISAAHAWNGHGAAAPCCESAP